MEKLINILNEYETPRSGVVYKSYDNYDGFFYGVDCDGETEIVWSDSLICSKKFGWIGWLVENKRIDVAKFGAVWEYESRDYWEDKEGNVTDYYYDNFEKHSDYESLLMLLAIQDEPINFLISILK